MQFGNMVLVTGQVQYWGIKALSVVAILFVTWLLAKLVGWLFANVVNRIKLLQSADGSGDSVGASLGKIVGLLIWLFGLIAVLQQLGLNDALQPLQNLLNQAMGALPGIIGAGIVMYIGVVIAKIVAQIVETSLSAVNFDKLAARGSVDAVTGTSQISGTIATTVRAIILILFGIAALDVLHIEAIAGPAREMLAIIMASIPRIIGAAIILGIGYMIARFASRLLTTLLAGLGVDGAVAGLGLFPPMVTASAVIGQVAMIALLLFASIAAVRMLEFPELTAILDQVLHIGGNVVFGSVIIAVGFAIANMLAGLVSRSTGQGGLGGNIVRYAAIFLFVTMGLSQMNIGGNIVQLFAGAAVIGGAVAMALAFGLGGREWAARQLTKLEAKADDSTPAE